ncbi:MAG: anti-sigma factor, partial [Herbiconiux sp.]|nr:anti-sigma factor [Herbiconiux sp.]
MTDNRNDDDRDPRLLTGSYSLDALSREEAESFERDLEGSESLRHETDELQQTATILGLATAPVEPSAGLKSALMAKLGDTPQLPRERPATVQDAPAPSVDPVAPVAPLHSETPTAAPRGAELRA